MFWAMRKKSPFSNGRPAASNIWGSNSFKTGTLTIAALSTSGLAKKAGGNCVFKNRSLSMLWTP